MSDETKKLIQDVGIGVSGIVLTILFNFLWVVIVDPVQANTDPNEVFGVQFDLLILAISLLVGADISARDDGARGRLSHGYIACFIATILVLVAAGVAGRSGPSWNWVSSQIDWIKIWIPDIFSAVATVLAIYFVRRA
jgi:hypothetical protein